MEKLDYIKKCKEVLGMYATNNLALGVNGALFSNDKRSIFTLRSHARGVQDSQAVYRPQLDPTREIQDSNGNLKRTGNWTISWDPIKVLPKFRSLAIQKITDLILIPKTEAIDETARLSKKYEENRMKLIRNPSTKAIHDIPDKHKEIETESDVDFISQMGGIRLAVEIMMKDGIDITMYKSNFPVVTKMLAEDIVDVNAMAVHQFNKNGEEIIEYVDAARIIVRPSIYPDFRDSDFRGFTQNKNADQIILEGNFTDKKITEKIRTLDKTSSRSSNHTFYSNQLGHREFFSDDNQYITGVEVMTLYFLKQVDETYIEGRRPSGTRQFESVDNDFKLTKRMEKAGKTLSTVTKFVLHKCKWITETDIVYGEGVVDYIVREGEAGKKSVLWPMTIYAGHEPSLMSRCIAFDDDLQIANFTLRNIYSKIPPGPRMIIFKDKIKDSVTIAGEQFSILDMITKYQSEGIMVLEGQNEYSEPGDETSHSPPIMFMPTGVSEDLTMLQNRMMQSVDFIRQVTGINEVADGSSGNPDMLKSVMEGLSAATNSALKGYVDLYINAYKSIIKYTGLKYQNMVVTGDVNLGYLPVSSNWSKPVTIDKTITNHDWGIMVDITTRESRQMLIMDLQSRREQLPPESYLIVMNMIEAGDMKKAQFYLAKYTAKATEENHSRQLEIAQATAKANSEAAQATEMAKANTVQVQGQSKLMEIEAQAMVDETKAISDHKRSIELLEMTNKLQGEREVTSIRENNRNRLDQ